MPLWKSIWWFLAKLKIFLPYNTATVLLGFYPHELKMYVYGKTCIQLFIAAYS